jgi:hypothetical protein
LHVQHLTRIAQGNLVGEQGTGGTERTANSGAGRETEHVLSDPNQSYQFWIAGRAMVHLAHLETAFQLQQAPLVAVQAIRMVANLIGEQPEVASEALGNDIEMATRFFVGALHVFSNVPDDVFPDLLAKLVHFATEFDAKRLNALCNCSLQPIEPMCDPGESFIDAR